METGRAFEVLGRGLGISTLWAGGGIREGHSFRQ